MTEKKPANAWHDVRGVTYEELRASEALVMEKYGDIIDCPRPFDPARKKASPETRAAQFLPFAALTGFDDEIAEEGRWTEERMERSEGQNEELDRNLREIMDLLPENTPEVSAVVFQEDPRKEGGAYVTKHGFIKKIDKERGVLLFTDRTSVPLSDLMDLYLIRRETEKHNGE